MTTNLSAAELAGLLHLPPPTHEQAAVIEAPLTPSLVVAGAGSGKTETMAARVVYLVANGLVRPEQVLGLTFTRKAAGQLAERIRRRLHGLAGCAGIDSEVAALAVAGEPEVSTYHGFAGKVIAEFGPLTGIDTGATVLTPTAAWQLARRVVGSWEGDLPTDRSPELVTETVLDLAGALSDHLRRADELQDHLQALVQQLEQAPPGARQRSPLHSDLRAPVESLRQRQWALPLVAAFEQAKRTEGVVDFADQMQLAAGLASHPSVVSALRDRHRVVLLDEYQDTGHAQRVILSSAFGPLGGAPGGHPVTAVGDPVQSIYTWRGASSSNLRRFGTDFPGADGAPAPRYTLMTSFRNPAAVLELANALSEPVRQDVPDLVPTAGAPQGEVSLALFDTMAEENLAVAEFVARYWQQCLEAGQAPPTTAVLMRRRREMSDLADALRRKGLDVEVVGLGGLLDEPEVADVVSTLQALVDPTAGASVLRLLSGPRWRIGMADLAALAARAGELTARRRAAAGDDQRAVLRMALREAKAGTEEGDEVPSLIDALNDLGEADRYSAVGYRRLVEFAAELAGLRARLGQGLPELVADVISALRLDIEAAVAGPEGSAHLDAFADEVDRFVAIGGGVADFLDYLAAAADRENGLAPGEVELSPGRVQLLTVHAAKGLEWDLVVVPHLSKGIFPAAGKRGWLSDAAQLPPDLRGDRADVPVLELPPEADQKELAGALGAHAEAIKQWQLDEELRLAYVAVTRAQRALWLSGHHWPAGLLAPRGPSSVLTSVAEWAAARDHPPVQWAPAPEPGAANPLIAEPRTAQWPVDPLGERRPRFEQAAQLVTAAIQAAAGDNGTDAEATDDEWSADVEVLLAEWSRGDSRQEVTLPSVLSATSLVDLAHDPADLARRLRRPVPAPPSTGARRGSAFHRWVEAHYGGQALLSVDDLPGADDRDAAGDVDFDELVTAFLASEWAGRTPLQTEVSFTTTIGPFTVPGRMDAVFVESDGSYLVVDWKTARAPRTIAEHTLVQLAVYRLAWAELIGVDVQQVHAALHFVPDGITVRPAQLADRAALSEQFRAAAEPAPTSI